MSMTLTRERAVLEVVDSPQATAGAGIVIRRPFPSPHLRQLDPFLLFDHFGPVDVRPGEAQGFPEHPHRGFETVTYQIEGAMAHRDSFGGSGELHAGDMQWMTAGSGLVHSEMPAAEFARQGGRLQGIQLWVNLPRAAKMSPPRYGDVRAERIPVAQSPDGRVTVKVLSGEALGVWHTLGNRTPFTYLHVTVQPGGRFAQPIPVGQNAFAYVLSGLGKFGPDAESAAAGHLIVFDPGSEGDAVIAASTDTPLEVLLLAGVPIGEPIARYGPFVMNTPAEIQQAVEDYRNGRMGTLSE